MVAVSLKKFLLTYSFPLLNQRIGTSGAFLIYAAICFAGALFVFTAVKETKSRSLEDLETSTAGK